VGSESRWKTFRTVCFITSISLSPFTTSRCKPGGGLPALKKKSETAVLRMSPWLFQSLSRQHWGSPTVRVSSYSNRNVMNSLSELAPSFLPHPPPFDFFETGFLCSPGCPWTHSLDHPGFELRNLPASASQVLQLKACATTAWFHGRFEKEGFIWACSSRGLRVWRVIIKKQSTLSLPTCQQRGLPAPKCYPWVAVSPLLLPPTPQQLLSFQAIWPC
jgi:hypothetical protein